MPFTNNHTACFGGVLTLNENKLTDNSNVRPGLSFLRGLRSVVKVFLEEM